MLVNEMATFVEAAGLGSIAAAGRSLGLPKSTVSRRIRRLEEELGTQLVQTGPRFFRLTEAGEALRARSAPAVRELRDALHAARNGDAARGVLHVSVPQDFAASVAIAQLFSSFRRAHTDVELELSATDRMVDLTHEGVDFAFRISVGPTPGGSNLMARRLAGVSAALFASPAYLERRGVPAAPADLAEHDMLLTDIGPVQLRNGGTGVTAPLPGHAPVRVSSMSFLLSGACADMGIAPINTLISGPLVASGQLVPVLPEWGLEGANLHLIWPSSRLESPRRRTFIDFVVEYTRSWPDR